MLRVRITQSVNFLALVTLGQSVGIREGLEQGERRFSILTSSIRRRCISQSPCWWRARYGDEWNFSSKGPVPGQYGEGEALVAPLAATVFRVPSWTEKRGCSAKGPRPRVAGVQAGGVAWRLGRTRLPGVSFSGFHSPSLEVSYVQSPLRIEVAS